MNLLSITFHCVQESLQEWEQYMNETLVLMTNNLLDVSKYILSDIKSDFIEEGKNYNLLLIFDLDEKRQDFILSELPNITERIESKFGQNVMIFNTLLEPIKSNI